MAWRALFLVLLGLWGAPAGASELASLTAEERAFLASHPTIRVRMQGDLPPFLFQKDGKPQGMSVDYLTVVAGRLGLTIEAAPEMAFSEVPARLAVGDGLDVQPVMRETPDRTALLNFTQPYLSFPIVIVTRHDGPAIGQLADLAGKTVAVEKSYWVASLLRRDLPDVTLDQVASSLEALRQVAAGKADAYVGVLAVVSHLIDNQGLPNLKVAAPTPYPDAALSMAVRRDWPLLASAMGKALTDITPAEHRSIRQRWLSVRFEYGLSQGDLLLWALVGGGGALILVTVLSVANYRLRREVGERIAAQQEARSSQEVTRALLDASPDAAMLIELDGTLVGGNEVFAQRFGTSLGQLLGRNLFALFPPDLAASRKMHCAEVAASGKPILLDDKRGDLYLHNRIYPVVGSDGVVRRLAIFSTDMSAYEHAMSELRRSNQDLEQFAYVASHDLRSPLRTISSFVSLLERRYGDRLDADGREFIAYARDGAARLDVLMSDLLEYSRVGHGASPAAPVSSQDCVRRAVAELEADFNAAGAELVVLPDLPLVVGDEGELTRLFLNLFSNALKYRHPDRPARISVSARRDGLLWEFAVTDNGIGIAPEHREQVFGIFQRLHPVGTYEGTGIGLALCKKIVEVQGGSIWISPDTAVGTSVHFTLRPVE